MTSEAFREMMRNATASVRLANASNQDLIQSTVPYIPKRPGELAGELAGRFVPEPKVIMKEALALNKTLGILPTTDEARLNKNERRYLEWLRRQGDQWIGVQCITLKIGHDCRFTPDFWALDQNGLRAIDVKARWSNGAVHVEDDARVKLQVAARLFRFIHFVIAWREGEIWHHKVIEP